MEKKHYQTFSKGKYSEFQTIKGVMRGKKSNGMILLRILIL
jgi:hypothetical protein